MDATSEPWVVPAAHLRVLEHIKAGRGAWYEAERPKQRGHRSGLLKDLKARGMIGWTVEDGSARFFLTGAGHAAIARATTGTT